MNYIIRYVLSPIAFFLFTTVSLEVAHRVNSGRCGKDMYFSLFICFAIDMTKNYFIFIA